MEGQALDRDKGGCEMKVSTCRGCHAAIVWIRTTAGKSMPCNARPVTYTPSDTGSQMIVTPDGRVVRGDVAEGIHSGSLGYISHFATCPKSRDFKKPGNQL